MVTIQEVKEKRKKLANKNKKPEKQGNNWYGFASSLGSNILNLIVIVILGANLIFSIRNMGLEEYFPTNTSLKPYNVSNISSLFKSFPYKEVKNPETTQDFVQNWFAKTMKYSWSFNRGIFQEVLKGINDLTDVSFPNMKNVERRMKMEKYAKKAVESIFFILSPFIILLLGFLAGTIGFISTILGGYRNTEGFFNNVAGTVTGYFLAYTVSTVQFFWGMLIIALKPFTINLVHLFKTVKEFRGLIMFLFIVFVLSSAMNNLSQPINIGLIIGLIILFSGTIISRIF